MVKIDLESLGEFTQILFRMETSFEKLFVVGQGKEEIAIMIEALNNNNPILPLVESSRGSFSTLFSPFHGGTLLLRSKSTLMENENFHPKLRHFCKLAGKIESATDTMSTYEDEPSDEEKKRLLSFLIDFFAIIPSHEEFKSWIAESLVR